MANREAFVIIAIAFLIHFAFVLDEPSWWIYHQHKNSTNWLLYGIAYNASIGAALLLFPLFGLIADIYLTRYRMLQLSLLMLVFILIVAMTTEMVAILLQHVNTYIDFLSVSIVVVSAIASVGIFEANAIQFGMDQLLEASSAQLSSFVHWYFWAIHLGQQSLFLTALIGTLIISTAIFDQLTMWDILLLNASAVIIILLLWMSSLATSSWLFHRQKKHMYIA